MDFNEAMREQEEKDRKAADAARYAEARHSVEAERAVAEVKQALVDMARYLSSKSAAQYRFVHVAKGKGFFSKSKWTESPTGFAVRATVGGLSLLTPEGRLWSFRYSYLLGLDPESGWIEITRESLEKGISLGPHTVYWRSGRGLYVPRNDDTPLTFMGYMTRVATNYLAQRGNYEIKGLIRVS